MKRVMLCLVLLSLVVSLASNTFAGETTKNNLIVGVINEPTTLDPIGHDDPGSYMVMAAYIEGLFIQDADLKPQLCLAERYEVVDNTTYRFFLKKGVKFHNGEELKASDVVFSLKRLAAEPLKESFAGPLDPSGIFAEGDYTVIIKTKYPYAPILSALASDTFGIVNEKAVKEMGEDKFGRAPVGTGPWKFVSWNSGVDINFERFDEYHDDSAKSICKDLNFRIIVEPANRVIELETGGCDIIQNVPSAALDQLQNDPNIQMFTKEGLQLFAVEFNQMHKPLENTLVRQALITATDVQAVCDVVWEGREKAVIAPLAKATRGYTEDVQRYDYDPEKAKAMLKEAGFPNGFTISISINQQVERMKIAEMLQAMWDEVGVKLDIKQFEVGAFTTHLRAMEHNIFIAAINNPLNDPDSPLFFSFRSENTHGAGNFTAYNSPEVDQWLMDARSEPDIEKNTAIYEKILKKVVDDAAWLPITSPSIRVAARNNVMGFEVYPTNYHKCYNRVWFK